MISATIVGLAMMFGMLSIMILIFYTIHWSVHKTMTKNRTKNWGYGTFDNFKKEFHKYKWNATSDWPNSLFDYSTDSQIHASIYKFSGNGMVMRWRDYWRATLYYRKFTAKEQVRLTWN